MSASRKTPHATQPTSQQTGSKFLQSKAQNFLQRIAVGIDWSGKWSCAYEAGDYAILRKTPGRCWAGLGSPARYVPVRWVLVRTMTAISRNLRGLDAMDESALYEHYGRMSPTMLKKWKQAIADVNGIGLMTKLCRFCNKQSRTLACQHCGRREIVR